MTDMIEDGVEFPDPALVDGQGEAGDVPASLVEDAAWYARWHMHHYRVFKRLREYCADFGPIRLPSGTVVGLYSDGNEWDHEGIARDLPNLIQSMSVRISGDPNSVGKAIELVLESDPALGCGDAKYEIDRDAANGVLRSDGEAAKKLREHIHPKPGRLDCR